MKSTTQDVQAIDTRWVFQAYAVVGGLVGLLLLIWGPAWLASPDPWLVRAAGASLVAAAWIAVRLAGIDDPYSRRRALNWFAIGHAALLVTLFAIGLTVAEQPPDLLIYLFGTLMVALFWVSSYADGGPSETPFLTGLFQRATQPSDAGEPIRSRYERQIREAAKLEERNRLARDLHDSVKQQIFAIQTAAATAQVRLNTAQPGVAEALEQVRNSARDAMAEMQAMLDQMRAVPLENTSLTEAVKRQCEALEIRTGAKVGFHLGSLPPSGDLPPGAHEAILRVAQEALANVGRHARAQSVTVSLGATAGAVELAVRDDGAGFDTGANQAGQGLLNIRERAREFGGSFEIISRPGAGTSITFAVPYVNVEPAAAYLREALIYALGLVVLAPLFVWSRRHVNPVVVLYGALWTLMAARSLVIWRRVKAREQANLQ